MTINIKRSTLIYASLCVVLLTYLCVATTWAVNAERNDVFEDLEIRVEDKAQTGFLTSADIDLMAGDERTVPLSAMLAKKRRKRLSTRELEERLQASDKIESVHVNVLNNGKLLIDVVPMQPVARVFDSTGSYYINAEGKRIDADMRHKIDVPVVTGDFATGGHVVPLLPMLETIKEHPEYDALVTAVSRDRRGNIIITPAVTGHVIVFGDTSMVVDKFERVRRFYKEVMTQKGWTYYDTLNVKWRGRLVATRRNAESVRRRELDAMRALMEEDAPEEVNLELGDQLPLPPDAR